MSADIRADVAAVGARIRRLRLRLGLTPIQVADRAGVIPATVRALERGTTDGVNLHTLTGIARALEVPVGVLLGEQPPPLHWPMSTVFWRQAAREIDGVEAPHWPIDDAYWRQIAREIDALREVA